MSTALRQGWEALQDSLIFLPPFPDQLDPLVLFSLLLVGGLIVTETVFNIPGVARFLVEAILWRDYPIVQNLVMLIAFCVVVVNFLVDMAYMALDPRIKYAD